MTGTKFDVDVIAAAGEKAVAYAAGAVVFERGDAGECAYIIKRGRVEIRERGRPLEIMQAGEIFGEMALIDSAPRTATAVALGAADLIPICKPVFNALIHDDPDFVRTIMLLMARRLRAAMNLLDRCIEGMPVLNGAAPEPMRVA
jgi:CRP-like cAMP-binding protein